MSILAKNVRTIRCELGCTQSEFARVLRVGFRSYVRYEAGERDAPIATLVKIAFMGNLSLNQLLTSELSGKEVCPLYHPAHVSTVIDSIDLDANKLHLKDSPETLAIVSDSVDKKFLTLIRKMDPSLQEVYLKNVSDADWASSMQNDPAGADPAASRKRSASTSKTRAGDTGLKQTAPTQKRGRKKRDPKAEQEKIDRLKSITRSIKKITAR
ncbi:MAG: helix-turn-helix transcriptional regulator [Candidatus Nitrohelix vancouverensis]|uniref:Helix-turn-helix transcriptional regulator n=1 Tax=Candidatus Nitrohelix vancouverensis TaxID=2705534 RepID=A0A7T0G3Q3_9BACT|nr:MAG: helix-turn-helix transcriptional regulator [Candidatus Nitrohelix vancouverensis]